MPDPKLIFWPCVRIAFIIGVGIGYWRTHRARVKAQKALRAASALVLWPYSQDPC